MLEPVLAAGFVFWGLFVVFGLIVLGYVAWMVGVERREGEEVRVGPEGPGEGGSAGRTGAGP